MRTAVDNPFMPGSDVVPPVWAGRAEQISEWESVVRPRRVAGVYERGRTILGEAGMGKSALVRLIASRAAAAGDWVSPQIRIPSGSDPLKALAAAVLGLADRAGLAASRDKKLKALLNRVRSLSAFGFSVDVTGPREPEPHTALTALLVEVGQAAMRQHKAVLIHVDEVQNITDADVLSQVLVSLGDALAYEVSHSSKAGTVSSVLPLAVYLTGLPDFADMTDSRKGATFSRRFATTTLEPISDDEMLLALRAFVTEGWPVTNEPGGKDRVWMEPEAASALVRFCRGEPFLFQLAGERAWYAGAGDVITAEEVTEGWSQAASEATAHVERIMRRLPEKERRFLDVMAALPAEERTASRIAAGMGYASASQSASFAQRLDGIRGIISRGSPYTFRHRAVEAYLAGDWPE